ncbi:MFS family permease [Clostridium acetobutylicum]|uniref:MDR-type permease n=1 Tax=Clostridium acetobutylicum (strain ATCC 824 / DSM 792 / JCM 1419 / IAM 19013 / LMG 5710 / NBRC 13948 / NRRL B-527 / VKM B-1787 / 2291 / W) TaxID=272562 RepID=Q97IY3_CLOAB|nr:MULTISPECIES: MFS transporter [Clostridium]AAK79471.1 MDR-type permease [Clostridium acetobutylicum ATCC 824]ADZ20556.1 MDR-type permease [Clostridium acetobutylicum EA 2018]AEI33990.1 MDR-type permease [Clostridium acetobutylicum DSM 1731]AWV81284.1 MFS transporter [Clostridium acetobutylicum]MBC2392918.1 MFS transporter [Clostridium acetobutylicum]
MKNIYRNSNFIIYLIGIFISGIGTKLTTIALANKVIGFSGGDFNVNLVYILQSIPILVLGMFAGNLVDKKNKKIVFIMLNIMLSFTSFAFALTNNRPIVFLLVFITGIMQAFYIPVETTLITLLVNKKHLAKANGIIMSINGIIIVIGYAFAGVLISFVGNDLAFIIDGVSFMIVGIMAILLKVSEKLNKKEEKEADLRQDIIQGWKFIKNNENIKWMFLIDVIITLIISMQTPLTYIFVEKYLGGSVLMPKRVGLLFAFAGIGTIFGGAILGRFQSRNKLMLLAICLVIDSVVVTVFAINRYFPFSLVLFSILGILDTFNGGILRTVLQEKTPKDLLGRVSGFVNSVVQPVSVLSLLIGGVASSFIEVKWVFTIGAAIELSTGIYFIVKQKSLFQ